MKSLYNGFNFLVSGSGEISGSGEFDSPFFNRRPPQMRSIYTGTSNAKKIILFSFSLEEHTSAYIEYTVSPLNSTAIQFTPVKEIITTTFGRINESPDVYGMISDRVQTAFDSNLALPSEQVYDASESSYAPTADLITNVVKVHFKSATVENDNIQTIIRGFYYLL